MSLARTVGLNGLATLVRLGAGLMLNKLLALHVGPSGFGLVGQFQSVVAMVAAACGGAFAPGVTKLTAEHGGHDGRQLAVWRTAAMLGLGGAGACALLLLAFGAPVERALGLPPSAEGVSRWMAVAAVPMAANAVLLAVLGGLKRVRAVVAAGIAGSLLSLAVAAALVTSWGLYGALAALALGQAAAGLATMVVFRRSVGLHWRRLLGRVDRDAARALGGFALMAGVSAVVVPLAQIAVRHGLARWHSPELAGLWQAMWKLSETHLMLLTTTLSLHFLPRFAEIRDGRELVREVQRGYRFVIGLVAATATATYLLREPLVRLLFSAQFVPLADALGWQLVGDVLKIASWVPAFTMISHARTRLFIVLEVAFSALLAGGCLFGAWLDGLRGTAVAYAAVYAAYWAVVHWQLGRLARRLDGAAGADAPATRRSVGAPSAA